MTPNLKCRHGLMFLFLATLISSCASKPDPGAGEKCAPTVAPAALSGLSTQEKIALFKAEGHQRFILKYANTDAVAAAVATTSSNPIKTDTSVRHYKVVKTKVNIESLDSKWAVMAMNAGSSLEEALSEASELGEIAYFEPDYPVELTLAFSDPGLPRQWAHATVRSAEAWDISEGNHNVIVAVVDSGTELTHSDLKANLWRNPGEIKNGKDDDGNGYIDDVSGWNFVDNNANPTADASGTFHGTHVGGTIGAVGNNGIGVSGHAPHIQIMPLKFLNSSGSGSTSNAIKAVYYAIEKGARIINNSWGSRTYSQAMQDAITAAEKKNILFVAAAGNGGLDGKGDDNDKTPWYPSNYSGSNMLTVAATDETDHLTGFSNFGLKSVHIAAPGKSIYSTRSKNGYATLSGTSMAAPLVSGVAATIFALVPDISARDVKNILMKSVDSFSHMKVTAGGRINAAKALRAAKEFKPIDPSGDPSGNNGGGGDVCVH